MRTNFLNGSSRERMAECIHFSNDPDRFEVGQALLPALLPAGALSSAPKPALRRRGSPYAQAA